MAKITEIIVSLQIILLHHLFSSIPLSKKKMEDW